MRRLAATVVVLGLVNISAAQATLPVISITAIYTLTRISDVAPDA